MREFKLHDVCWYSGRDHRIVSSGRVVHIIGNGNPYHPWAKPFRRGNLWVVSSGTPEQHRVLLFAGKDTGNGGWVHSRFLSLLEGRCSVCGDPKPYNDWVCIKCRSKGLTG